MFKRISCLALSVVLLLGILVQQVTALTNSSSSDQQITASTGPTILLDGVIIKAAASFVYAETTYVSLRSVATALRPDAVVTWKDNHATVTADGLSITVYPNEKYIVANGRYLYLPYGVRTVSNRIMLPVRALTKAMDAQVQWSSSNGSVYITSGTGAITPGSEYYDSDAVYWLSHIIYAESGNQPLDGKIGVGNVILNRVSSPLFPNTIYAVIFQRNQFSPAGSGSIYKDPSSESVIAAKLCLDGAVVLPSALWFNTAKCSSWASKNRSYVATIGAHAFYS